jgi:hypothetical protein
MNIRVLINIQALHVTVTYNDFIMSGRLCHVGPALPTPTTRSGAATTGKLIDRQIDIQGKLIDIQGKLIGMQGKRESRSLFPLLADHISIYWM